jgi:hypothetical protein
LHWPKVLKQTRVFFVTYENLVLVALNLAAILDLFFGNKTFYFFLEFVLEENADSYEF